MDPTKKASDGIAFFGRVLLALIFIASGLSKIPGWEQTLTFMSAHGMPWPAVFLFPAIFVEVIGGFSVLVGFKARWASLILGLYLIPVTIIFHGFWNYSDLERQVQMVNFMKNLAILGGLLTIVGYGPGTFSIDSMLRRRTLKPLPVDGKDRWNAA